MSARRSAPAQTFPSRALPAPDSTWPGLLGSIQELEKPVVGRIDGACLGGGVGLAAVCDISVATTESRFGFSEVRLGVAPAIISVVCLAKMRRSDASELFLTGERFDAHRAAAVGLITRVVEPPQLDQAVDEVVERLLLGGPRALAATKRLIAEVPGMDRERGLRVDALAVPVAVRVAGGRRGDRRLRGTSTGCLDRPVRARMTQTGWIPWRFWIASRSAGSAAENRVTSSRRSPSNGTTASMTRSPASR